MKLLRNMFIVLIALYALELTTLHMWTHPAFMMPLAGTISVVYRYIKPTKIERRYPKWAKTNAY